MMAVTILGAHHVIERQIGLSGSLPDIETLGVTILRYAAGAWAAALACRLVAEAIFASPHLPDDCHDPHLLRLVARVAGLIGGATVLVHGAGALGIPTLGLAAGLGVGGVAGCAAPAAGLVARNACPSATLASAATLASCARR